MKLFVILGFKIRNDSYDPTLVTEVMTFTLKCIKCHPLHQMASIIVSSFACPTLDPVSSHHPFHPLIRWVITTLLPAGAFAHPGSASVLVVLTLYPILFCGRMPVMHGVASPSDYMLLEMYCVIDFWCNYLFIRACSLSQYI